MSQRGEKRPPIAARSEVRAERHQPLACPVPGTAARIGLLAFLFFLLKGLAWLVVPAWLWLWSR